MWGLLLEFFGAPSAAGARVILFICRAGLVMDLQDEPFQILDLFWSWVDFSKSVLELEEVDCSVGFFSVLFSVQDVIDSHLASVILTHDIDGFTGLVIDDKGRGFVANDSIDSSA
jgi:hypothetical protein